MAIPNPNNPFNFTFVDNMRLITNDADWSCSLNDVASLAIWSQPADSQIIEITWNCTDTWYVKVGAVDETTLDAAITASTLDLTKFITISANNDVKEAACLDLITAVAVATAIHRNLP